MAEINVNKIIELALAAGFTAAKALDPQKIELREDVRGMCEVNSCGKFGKNWACPPGCGSLDECRERIARFSRGIIVQTTDTLEDSLDFEGMQELGRKHAEYFEKFAGILAAEMEHMMVFGAGSCSRCESCTFPDSPCRFPELAHSSMEAYGMLVSDVCKQNDLPYYYGKDTLTYVGCYLFN